MDKSEVESQLSLIEAQLAFLHGASLADDPTQLPQALAGLLPMLVNLSKTLRDANSSASGSALVRNRLKKAFAMLAALREGMIRQSVIVERGIAALMPTAQPITYGAASSTLGHQPYGMAARQSGEFKMVAV